jgi:multicomponent K+:H+ antiporter subunit A
LLRDAAIAIGAGIVMTSVSYYGIASRPRASVITPYFEAAAKPLTGAADIVGAIVVDFRGFDTLVEITVFAMAGIGMYTLIRYALRNDNAISWRSRPRKEVASAAVEPNDEDAAAPAHTIFGIDGMPTSSMLHMLAYVLLPVMLVIGATQVMYGHDRPGDGFTAGVTISLAIAFWYVIFGYQETRRRLPWLKPSLLVACGLLLEIANASLPVLSTGVFFGHVDYGALVGLPLPAGFSLSSSFIFELAICLTVLGGATLILGALGHPNDPPVEG